MIAGVERRAESVVEGLVEEARREWRYWLRHREDGQGVAHEARRVARLCLLHARMLRFAVDGRHGSAAWERRCLRRRA